MYYSDTGLKDLQDVPKELLNVAKTKVKYNSDGSPNGCEVEYPSPAEIVKLINDTVAIDEEFRKRLALSQPAVEKEVKLKRD